MKLVRILILLSVGVSLGVFIWATDFTQVSRLLTHTGNDFWLLIITTCLGYICATISWRYCMGDQRNHIPVFRLFLIRHVGETVTLFNPASIIAGEAMKAWMLRNYPVKKSTVHASILVSRAIMIITQVVLFSGALILLLAAGPAPVITAGVVAKVLCWLAGVVLIVCIVFWGIKKARTTTVYLFVAKKTAALRAAMRETMAESKELYRNNRRALLMACFFTFLHWTVGSLEIYFILRILGTHADVVKSLLVDMGVVLFKSAGAFIPGQAGVEEYGNKMMLGMIGIHGTAIWIAASILRRVRQLFWLLVGVIAYVLIRRHGDRAYQL
ncbi:conserved hypothetical protein [Filimonas lacunae]|uniref:Lysylphosphatidylglycerol synthase TM region n=1 Tax=Filimonas lacunae TaxID=477680 RepID=A0A173MN77_9BACT|nr:lysylphosphatidylglycerol synthase transmembrane domain-containing protein [Filimonas lacunae]BAV08937.1 hypothetical protein FLA_4984 [Filimonas lacunae]SIS64316.1 conserved hypothetical protein [Filimonas lacunae]